MKAFLLSAGLGTRLRPLTHETPKCLLPISGKPLLAYWFDLFTKHGVDEVLINTHYQTDKFFSFADKYNGKITTKITTEPELLGSAGTVLHNSDFIQNENEFLVCYGDNLTNANLMEIIRFHRQKSAVLTCALFKPDNIKACGAVTLDDDSLIVHFEEKPDEPKSPWANAGIFVASPKLIDFISNKIPCDFGFDVLPKLINKSYGYVLDDFLLDIGTMENYEKAQKIADKI